MKKTFTVVIALLLTVNYSCKEKIDYEAEKEAIIAVVEEETAAYYANDFERWGATYLQDSTLVTMGVSKSGYNFNSGWESVSSDSKPYIEGQKEVSKEVKTPIMIKVYGKTGWITFNNEIFNDNDELVNHAIVTCYLEKVDDSWKIVNRDILWDFSFYQADNFLINSINYAKSLGKSVEEIASFTGDQFKTGWNQALGYSGFVNNMLNNWGSMVPQGGLNVQERDDNHIIFSANKMLSGLKANPQFNVTYDDYLLFIKVVCEKIGDYMGAVYEQETTSDGVLVTITKK